MSDERPPFFGPIEEEAYDWVMRFASGTATRADIKALQRWSARSPAHRAAFAKFSRTWKNLGPVAAKLSQEKIIVHESRRLVAPARLASSHRPVTRRVFIGGAVAASAAGAAAIFNPPLGLWPSWAELMASYRTKAGEQRHIVLSDGVSVAMNARTSIAVRPTEGRGPTIDLISGEAMIATPRTGFPFTVIAASNRVVATDARFNVWSDDRSVCVTCLAGIVRLERGRESTLLSMNQQITCSDGKIGQITTADPRLVTSWLSGVVIFQSTPIAQVIEEVNRYRPGRVILMNPILGRRQIDARFRIQDISSVITQIQQTFNANVTYLPGGVVLLG